jgi:protein-L-isoaspartate(D-aspartate) O-methyltransferase
MITMWNQPASGHLVVRTLLACAGCLLALHNASADAPSLDLAREQLVRKEIIGSGIQNPDVIRSIRNTPRHRFVALKFRKEAYFDMALPIGSGQTISSPFIVAYMTESLEPQPTDKVLEIGTGSGYQAAILSPLVRDVYTIEIVDSLARRARRTLRQLKYTNVHVKIGDGFQGWSEHAPFDKIIVTCSPEDVPLPLIDQLKEGGRMVIPVGERYQQTLCLMSKQDGQLIQDELRPTLFVPMTGTAEARRRTQPDPLQPRVINGSFEEKLTDSGLIPGWYYQRQSQREADSTAPVGNHVVTFQNDLPGRPSRALQGLPVDGRVIRTLTISAWVKHEQVISGGAPEMLPLIAISLYDERRQELGRWWLGPWQGSRDWRQVSKQIRIPQQAREGILRIGLFGSTGTLSLDDLKLDSIPR